MMFDCFKHINTIAKFAQEKIPQQEHRDCYRSLETMCSVFNNYTVFSVCSIIFKFSSLYSLVLLLHVSTTYVR